MKVVSRTFFFYLFVLFSNLSNASNTSDPLTLIAGDYVEVYTNNYVAITEQIDWQCVHVNIQVTNKTATPIQITKTAHLHDMEGFAVKNKFDLVNCDKDESTGFWSCTSNDMSGVSTLTRVPWKYTIRSIFSTLTSDSNTLLLTKDDNYSLYIWTKNITFFKWNVENKVLRMFQEWDYDTYYKTPYSYGGMLDRKCGTF
jgi:hypothetical protein